MTLRPTTAARDRYDEAIAADGAPRAHWRGLLETFRDASPSWWRERQDTAQQHIRTNGITYNVYADPKGAERPWALDIVPLVLAPDEWAGIASAIAQRAHLLDRVLADLYGEQQLLATRALPAALVYGHHGYLWPCQGIRPPGDRYLHVYAADIARAPDGRWWVLADRTQAPSGAGYALENRYIVSRLFPDAYRDLHVQHLVEYFRTLRDTLAAQAPVDDDELPRVVLLTPGPLNETYFEHVYLARHLGFPLVEGQDLTVRGDTLYLKTLGGLQRVHAVLRRLDDDFCDPLDLRTDSTLGVPGLVEVARAGRVLVANALGSGVLESAGVTGFLPSLCERLLGEPLAMPSVATWWCGEAAALDFVVANLERLVLKPAYPSQRMEPVFGHRLDAAARDQWIARLRARPGAYVAQELVELSQAPSLASDLTTDALGHDDALALQPRSIGLRVYAVATADGGYRVLPGGLARVAGDTSVDVVSMQRGGSSKDTWVLGDAASASTATARQDIGVRDLVRTTPGLASRAAENLFWLGRYAERVECHARLLRQAMSRLVEQGAQDRRELPALVSLAEHAGLLPLATPDAGDARIDRRLLAAVFDDQWPGSLAANLQRAGRAAAQVRERLSVDHWQAIERLQDVARRARATRPRLDLALSLLDRVLMASTALAGYAHDDMVRDAGWRFLVAGRRLERVQAMSGMAARLLVASPPDTAVPEVLLGIADCDDTWRHRYPFPPELLPALDIVLFDDENPRALAFQAAKLQRAIDKLRRAFADVPDGDLPAALASLRAWDLAVLEDADAGALAAARLDLADRLVALGAASSRLSDQLGNRFFTHIGDGAARSVAV